MEFFFCRSCCLFRSHACHLLTFRLASQAFSSEVVYDQRALTQPDSSPRDPGRGALTRSAHMLMISLLNAPTSTAKRMHLCVCVFMPKATNSLLTITRNGGCVRVYSSSGRNLSRGGEGGLLPYFPSTLAWMCRYTQKQYRCVMWKSDRGSETSACVRYGNNSPKVTC